MGEQRLEQLSLRLEKYNPQAPLARGYALVYRNKDLIRAVDQVHVDDRLSIHWGSGHVDVLVQPTLNHTKTKTKM
jgi:exonuclease VII large subunit